MASNINAGLQQYGEVANPGAKATSVTQDPFTPVEFGRNSAKSAYTTTASSGDDIPNFSAPTTQGGGGGNDAL
tara:strand:+ start:581 stop:799 length:219 start_codon:yes stop_codon:yes gene_type:complete